MKTHLSLRPCQLPQQLQYAELPKTYQPLPRTTQSAPNQYYSTGAPYGSLFYVTHGKVTIQIPLISEP